MGSQWGRDKVYVRALKEGYRSRAAYKLREIQEKYHILRETDNVVDLGASPGSWLQVERELTSGIVVGIDLSYIPPVENVITIMGDFTDPHTLEEVRPLLPFTSVVLSDASPKLSGQRTYDQARAIELGENALLFAVQILKPGGNFIVKSFQGQDFNTLLCRVREHFLSVRTFRPHSSRKGSTEIYIVAKNFIGHEWNSETRKNGTNETEGPI
ncbi:MAG: RlmE family RNA methyltransferase [Methanoregulaceae archaeon]|jgi:23S rRNA (uridine2552-2'-O)-methyltransferase|nr:RlmE family RNA methyltransferase [Methanoregulaceae archaeon]